MAKTCRGIDVSAYQGPQDWTAWKRQGIVFAFAKASEGQHSRDGRFAGHITGIITSGLVPGAYHFAWPNQDAATEAANYIGAVRPHNRPGCTHWLDLERYPDGRNYRGRSAAQIRAWVSRWIAIVQDAFPGQRVGIYTSASDIAAGHVPAGVPLWYPAYPGTAVDTYAEAEAHAQPCPSGRYALIWQFTSDPAGPDRIDQSIAYMSEAAFRAWAAGTTTATQEDDVPDLVNLGVRPYELKPGTWDDIEFTTEWTDQPGGHAAGGAVFAQGRCSFTGSLSLSIDGLPVGETVQVRMSEYVGDKHVHDHPVDEAIGTKGGTYHVTPLVKALGAGRGMRVRVLNNGTKPVRITSAVLTALVWKES